MKHQEQSQVSRKSRRRTRMSRIKTLFGILLAGMAVLGFLLTYLLDYKRLRTDVGHWLAEMDQSQRRSRGESQGQPGQ